MPDDPYLTVQDIVRELGVSELTVRTWIKDGRLRAIKAGRAYRVRRSDLDKMTGARSDEDQGAAGIVSLEGEPLMSQVVIPGDER
jgi:excisionase family DNA binding protein